MTLPDSPPHVLTRKRTLPVLPDFVKTLLMKSLDCYQSLRPSPRPCREKLKACKLISHRGEHDGRHILENTLQAFELAARNKVWGLELDVNWTKDLHPVVFHDPDLKRVFGQDKRLKELTLSELKNCCPLIPSLNEVLQDFGRRIHLMIELKTESYTDPGHQNQILQECLSGLSPETDYHLLTLNPALCELIPWVSPKTWVCVAECNLAQVSKLVLENGFQAIVGHYALVSNAYKDLHQSRGQLVGTAYAESKNCLFREINRGVDWIFSHRAKTLQTQVLDLS